MFLKIDFFLSPWDPLRTNSNIAAISYDVSLRHTILTTKNWMKITYFLSTCPKEENIKKNHDDTRWNFFFIELRLWLLHRFKLRRNSLGWRLALFESIRISERDRLWSHSIPFRVFGCRARFGCTTHVSRTSRQRAAMMTTHTVHATHHTENRELRTSSRALSRT